MLVLSRISVVVLIPSLLIATANMPAFADAPTPEATTVVTAADVGTTRSALAVVQDDVSRTSLAAQMDAALAQANGARVVASFLSAAQLQSLAAAVPAAGYEHRVVYAGNGFATVLDYTATADGISTRLSLATLDAVPVVATLATAVGVIEQGVLNVVGTTAQGESRTSVVLRANDCAVQCIAAGVTIGVVGAIGCLAAGSVPVVGTIAGAICALIFVTIGGGFGAACPQFASLCDDGPGGRLGFASIANCPAAAHTRQSPRTRRA